MEKKHQNIWYFLHINQRLKIGKNTMFLKVIFMRIFETTHQKILIVGYKIILKLDTINNYFNFLKLWKL
jgi:hypothetical protein